MAFRTVKDLEEIQRLAQKRARAQRALGEVIQEEAPPSIADLAAQSVREDRSSKQIEQIRKAVLAAKEPELQGYPSLSYEAQSKPLALEAPEQQGLLTAPEDPLLLGPNEEEPESSLVTIETYDAPADWLENSKEKQLKQDFSGTRGADSFTDVAVEKSKKGKGTAKAKLDLVTLSAKNDYKQLEIKKGKEKRQVKLNKPLISWLQLPVTRFNEKIRESLQKNPDAAREYLGIVAEAHGKTVEQLRDEQLNHPKLRAAFDVADNSQSIRWVDNGPKTPSKKKEPGLLDAAQKGAAASLEKLFDQPTGEGLPIKALTPEQIIAHVNQHFLYRNPLQRPIKGEGFIIPPELTEAVAHRKRHAYTIEPVHHGGGTFPTHVYGKLAIGMPELMAQKRLVAWDKKYGAQGPHWDKVLDEPIDGTGIHLLTKRYNPKIKYSPHAIELFRRLTSMSGLPENTATAKHKLLSDANVIVGDKPSELAQRLDLLIAGITAGNNSVEVRREVNTIIDALLRQGDINPEEHRALYNEFVAM